MTETATPQQRPIRSRMGRAALIVAAGVFLSRVLGLLRDIVFAAVLGADRFTDEYVLAFAIPDWINYLLAGGYMAVTFIPILSRHLAEGDDEGGWQAFSAIFRPVAIAMSVLVIIGMVLARPVIDLIAPDFTPDQVDRAVRLTRIVLPAQVFFVTGSLFMAVQYAKERFFVPTLAPIIYNLGIIAGGVLLNIGADQPTPDGFAWGVLAGAIVGNFAVQWYGARQAGLRMRWGTPWRNAAVKEYVALALPLMIGQSLVLLDEQLGRSFGTLAEDGGVTWLQYARRTMLVPVGIIAQAAGVAAYPFLARLAAEGRLSALNDNLARALRYVVVLSLGAAAGLAALSLPVVRVLYQRGLFDAADTRGTAAALIFFGIGVPAWGAQQVLVRGYYARRDMWTPVIVGTAATVVALPAYWLLYQAMGISGLALASTAGITLYTAVLAAIWYARNGWGHFRPVLATASRALPLAVLGGLGAWGAGELMRAILGAGSLLAAVGALVAGAAAFGAVIVLAGGSLWELRGEAGRPRTDRPG